MKSLMFGILCLMAFSTGARGTETEEVPGLVRSDMAAASERLCRQGGPATEAQYLAYFDRCNSAAGCGAICYPQNAYINGQYYTNGYYRITCACTN